PCRQGFAYLFYGDCGSTWYADGDGDGYGVTTDTVSSCEQPSGYVNRSTDCDDSLQDVHPDADEICDELDNDCDGETDEDDAVDAASWFIDFDGDGYGSDAYATTSCESIEGYVDNDSDCDDTDDQVHPEADDPVGDGADTNCDGEDGVVDSDTSEPGSDDTGGPGGQDTGAASGASEDGLTDRGCSWASWGRGGASGGWLWVLLLGLVGSLRRR
ncbi:MAG: putative metal-binding motif-containing protein, partial [Myxococcota bacterium]|nr:putative metal-binding motif-containing protein [Myxococcota bacterium]